MSSPMLPHRNLVDLPTEVLCEVIALTPDWQTAFAFMRTCKRIHALFDPSTHTGNRIYNEIRKKDRWPDPTQIHLSHHDFLQAMYGRGCQSCDAHPRIRNVTWEFDAKRLCTDCFRVLTIRDYELDPSASRLVAAAQIPFVVTAGYSSGRGRFVYRSYFKSDVLALAQAPDTIAARNSQEVSKALRIFRQLVEQRQLDLEDERARAKDTSRQIRKEEVTAALQQTFPQLLPSLYPLFATYTAATKLATPFTSRARSMFLTKFSRQLEDRKEEMKRRHIRHYLDVLVDDLDSHVARHLRNVSAYHGLEGTLSSGSEDILPSSVVEESLNPLLLVARNAATKC
ncbi:hypothetical protein HDU87_004342 [Geranomyces variabilis]|uniref:F-box domain-containing protein n=1 Tax=Geranomyces variabilis TaxID=109894 RepID=A0AAD5TK68_9FUNG|nr:hypothetical protein HDU87_004342 [Geranomyces variabilis]